MFEDLRTCEPVEHERSQSQNVENKRIFSDLRTCERPPEVTAATKKDIRTFKSPNRDNLKNTTTIFKDSLGGMGDVDRTRDSADTPAPRSNVRKSAESVANKGFAVRTGKNAMFACSQVDSMPPLPPSVHAAVRFLRSTNFEANISDRMGAWLDRETPDYERKFLRWCDRQRERADDLSSVPIELIEDPTIPF